MIPAALIRRLGIGLAVAAGLLATAPSAEAAAPRVVAGGPQTVASGLTGVTLGGLAVARDGTGALVYSARVGTTQHAYLSRLSQGSFAPPQQLDIAGGSQPVVAADNDGTLLVAFRAGSDLYVEESLGGGPFSAPLEVAAGAANPSIAINLIGVGYLAYSAPAPSGGGNDVYVDYWNGSTWTPASPAAMNVSPGDDAGTGTGAPSVAAATDGVGIVAWGERGHVYSRRVAGTQTSVETEQDDTAALGGQPETSATAPQVAVGGDSSYPDIVYSASFGSGSGARTRAMLTRLVAEQTRPVGPIDGAGGGASNGGEATVAMGEGGRGMIAAASGTSTMVDPATTGPPFGVTATVLGSHGTPGAATSEAAGDPVDPHPVAATFGQISSGLAWIDGTTATAKVELAYSADGTSIDPPITLSGAGVQAASGVLLDGDDRGDAVAAWVQNNGDLVVNELYTPPGTPTLTPAAVTANTSTPVLTWNPAPEFLGPLTYTVAISNGTAQTTEATSAGFSGVTDGRYRFSVTATNRGGQTGPAATGTLIVDTYAPRLTLALGGAPRVGQLRRLMISDVDAPNPAEAGAVASGVRGLTVSWGDGTPTQSGGPGLARTGHVYTAPGLYTVTVTVADAVSNTTTLSQPVRVLP